MPKVHAFAAHAANSEFEPFEYELPSIGVDQVDIEVQSCGICHSDLSMRNDEWGMTQYPFVGGHEVIGKLVDKGSQVRGLEIGDRVGLGWYSRSCMHCDSCINGHHNLCLQGEGTITHQMGGFADRVRCHYAWAIQIPENLPPEKCGPLLCGGVTVFTPLLQHQLSPTSRAAIVGIGGLGHMALKFLKAWGCEVTAISRSRTKEEQARSLGAHQFIATGEEGALEAAAGTFDLILNTTNAMLPWDAYVNALAPQGTLHNVGAAPKIEASVFPMILGQKSIASSPVGSIGTTRRMFDFCARHNITADVEVFDMQDINAAMDRLESSPAHRIVLKR